ncbi:MAG: Ig-like domain repeat protein [Acidobacteriaceae bacterium]
MAISPQGAALQTGSTQQFTVVCAYSDGTTDDCAVAGGATWGTSRIAALTVNSSGLATWAVDPGAGNANMGYVTVTAGGLADRAGVYGQHPGDTWYQYPTPDIHNYENPMTNALLPLNVVVGSTVAMGSGLEINNNGSGGQPTGQPFQDQCNWTSSNTAVATVNRIGDVTAVAPGSVTITCGRAGNAVFGASALSGWVSPGNTIALTVVAGGTSNTTWYVRPDGGTVYSSTNTAGQCSGKVDASYASTGGTGTNQACAAGNLRYLWADGVTYQQLQWVIQGGDTVIVAQNPNGYNTGLDQASPYQIPAGTAWSPINCAGNPFCSMPTIPSGTAAQHTRILGANYADCHADAAKTLLIASYSAGAAIDASDSQFVDVACFEITDKAACADNGNYTNSCHNSALDFGINGIGESALTSDVTYTDMFIHGLGGDGIHGATGVGVVANYVHIQAMTDAGINMDDSPWGSGNISVAGGFTMTNSVTEFTGCVEEYPVVHQYPYIECRDQNTGAYGDGFGTASTSGNWSFDHDVWQYNYQDGLDLLHSGMTSLTVTNSLSQGNEGQSYKIGSGKTILFQNDIALDNCNRLAYVMGDEPASSVAPGAPNGSNYSLCRAAGDWVPMYIDGQGTITLQGNTWVGYGATPFDTFCDGGWTNCSKAKTAFQDNIVLGYSDSLYNGGALPGLFYEENPSADMPTNLWVVRDHNLYYNTRYGCPTPLGTGELCADPLFVGEVPLSITAESQLDNYNFHPSSSSPAIGAGISIPGLTTDNAGIVRPSPPSIGALEYAAGSTQPAASQVSIAIAPNPATVGQSIAFTASVTSIGSTAPTGTVTFYNGGTTLGSGYVENGGIATYTTASLVASSYGVTANYSGDANYPAGQSSVVSLTVNAPPREATTTSMQASPNPAITGQTVTLTATVKAQSGASIPTGTVTFLNGGTVLGVGTLNGSGIAEASTSSLAAGSYNLTAQYAGDANDQSSAAQVTLNVDQSGLGPAAPATSTSLQATPNPGVLGQTVTLTATIKAQSSGVVPQGIVSFLSGAAVLGQAPVNNSGVATLSTSWLAAGSYALTAQFKGNSGFMPSTSTAVTENVGTPSVTLLLSASALTVTAGSAASEALTITSAGGYSGTVRIACNNLPPGTTCSFKPESVDVSGSGGPVTIAGTIQTSAPVATAHLSPLQPTLPANSPVIPAVVFWMPGWLAAALAGTKRKLSKSSRHLLVLLLLLGGVGVLTACGGGHVSLQPTATGPSAATSTIQVVVTGTGNLTQSVNLSLTVQ